MDKQMVGKFVSRTEFSSYEDFRDNFKINAPEGFNFGYDIVDQRAQVDPDKVALVWCDDSGDERIFTFGDIKTYSDRAAAFLQALGISKGDAVMLILKRRYEFWICMVALHKIGAIAIPGSYLLTARDITIRNNAADVRMMITANDERVMDAVDESQPHSPYLRHKVVTSGARAGWHDLSIALNDSHLAFTRPTRRCDNNDTLLIWFTSGTTGVPKMVRHNQDYPLGHILTAGYWQRVQDNGLHLTVADTGWAKAGWGSIYGQWICGSAVFVYDYDSKFDPHKMLSAVEKHRVSTFCGPATVYRMLINEGLGKYDLSSIQHCVVAGEPLYPEVFNKVKDTMGLEIMEGFGQSETTVAVANFSPWMKPKPGSMGKPSPGYGVDIIDDEGRPCGPCEQGEVIFRIAPGQPAGMFCGYYRGRELTDAAWSGGVYHTGDIAWRDEDGYFWYVGRVDDAIKSSGYKIGPFEVESVLQEHPAVAECAVTGVPDPLRGQVVKASIVLNDGFEPTDELVVQIQEHVKQQTAPYKYPRVVEFVESLPKTTSGKVSRSTIKRRDYEKAASGS